MGQRGGRKRRKAEEGKKERGREMKRAGLPRYRSDVGGSAPKEEGGFRRKREKKKGKGGG